jgi:hypothetical protein
VRTRCSFPDPGGGASVAEAAAIDRPAARGGAPQSTEGGPHRRGRRHAASTMAAALGLAAALSAGKPAAAGPPFQTDDPEPVPFHHYEAYAFGVFDRSGGSTFLQAPAFEFNVGAAPNLQLHVVVPMAYQTPGHQFGVGDVEVGVKFRFVQESGRRPQIGTFPMLELPTGDAGRALGNGRLWARLPVWLQKSYGPWTTYGGVGYEVNRAPGMEDSLFAGWLLQRRLDERLALGAEVFSRQAPEVGGRGTTFVDAGGYLNFRENLSLLFMLGHTVAGESHAVGYLGLYYTWGHDRSPSAVPAPSTLRSPL